MSDVKGIEVSDVLGLSQPLTKLIETVSCGIGKLYEPVHIKRLAKAKSKEIELISSTVSNNINLPMCYENGAVSIDTQNANNLVTRAQNRFLFQQMKKQQNIDSIVANAYAELEDRTSVSEEPVDSDWISSFFDFIANISDECMQLLWGKLLAGEIERPGSFSIRTLDVLRKLTQREAATFQKIAPYILVSESDTKGAPDDYFLLQGDFLKSYNINCSDIMALNDAQIMSESNLISVDFTLQPGDSEVISNSSGKIMITNTSKASVNVNHLAYFLTAAGRELISIVLSLGALTKTSEQYLEECKIEILKGDFALIGDNTKIEKAVTIEVVSQ